MTSDKLWKEIVGIIERHIELWTGDTDKAIEALTTYITEQIDKAREEGWNNGYAQGLLEGFHDIDKFSKGIEVIDQALIKELEELKDQMEADPHCERYWVHKVASRISALKGGGE